MAFEWEIGNIFGHRHPKAMDNGLGVNGDYSWLFKSTQVQRSNCPLTNPGMRNIFVTRHS